MEKHSEEEIKKAIEQAIANVEIEEAFLKKEKNNKILRKDFSNDARRRREEME